MKKTLLILAIALSTASYSQLTNANFQEAVDECLSTNPVDGLCTTSEHGIMPDWDVSQVTVMSASFSNELPLYFNADISAWDTSNVTNMSLMFYNNPDFNQDISSWDVSSVNDMSGMFNRTRSFNQDISAWDTSNVTNMTLMFYKASLFNQDISSWDLSSVTLMNYMFKEALAFNQPIGDWNTSNVTDMRGLFSTAESFNQDISDWDVSKVINMFQMFYKASSFNQNISSWCVTNITSEPFQFSDSSPLTESNKPVWGSSCPTASVDDQNQLNVSIYPNPTSDRVYIEGNYTQLKVVVNDMLGKQVIKESITNSIDISQLEKGVYILQLSDGAKLTTQKILKN